MTMLNIGSLTAFHKTQGLPSSSTREVRPHRREMHQNWRGDKVKYPIDSRGPAPLFWEGSCCSWTQKGRGWRFEKPTLETMETQ